MSYDFSKFERVVVEISDYCTHPSKKGYVTLVKKCGIFIKKRLEGFILMKKLLAVLMCFVLMLGLCACGTTTVTSEIIVFEEDEDMSNSETVESNNSSGKNNGKESSSSMVTPLNEKIDLTLVGASIKSYSIIYPQNST